MENEEWGMKNDELKMKTAEMRNALWAGLAGWAIWAAVIMIWSICCDLRFGNI